MNKPELVEKVAQVTGLTKTSARKAVDAVFDTIAKALSGRGAAPVAIAGFGTFKVRRQKKRKQTIQFGERKGEVIEVPARKVPAFSPAKALKEAVNK